MDTSLTPNEKIVLNAAIQRVVEGADDAQEAAQTVICYGARFKPKTFYARFTSTHKSSGDAVSGFSPGHGEVTFRDGGRTEYTERTFGVRIERVGHYRIWKDKEGLLVFHHFWKSDVSTRSTDGAVPETFYLGYHKKTHHMKFVGVIRAKGFRVSLKFVGITIWWNYLERRLGVGALPFLGISLDFWLKH